MPDPYQVRVDLPMLPPLNNAAAWHWRKQRRERDKWINALALLIPMRKRPKRPLATALFSIERYSQGPPPDWDNLVSSGKLPLDALGTEFGIGVIENDKPSNIGRSEYRWIECPPMKGRTVITVIQCEKGDLDRIPWSATCDDRVVNDKGVAKTCSLWPGHDGLHQRGSTYWSGD